MSGHPKSSGFERDQRGLIDSAWAQVAEARIGAARDRRRSDNLFSPLVDEIPGYRILEEIHRGGQGVVYRCIQESTERVVALKIMIGGAFARPDERLRFAREVQILAELRHPNIVTIHDSGSAGNARYIVMDYVEGMPLDKYVRENRLTIDAKLRLVARICAAVHTAHLRGIIHRDLKPSNIRIDQSGDPHVLDFGLAKYSGEDEAAQAGLTVTGQFVGSLPWASPEQARGQLSQIDLRTDVYSLGVLLYQVLTGHFPYKTTGGLDSIVQSILHGEPADPRTLEPDIPADASAIVLKALRKEQDARYETAGSLGRDIERHLAGEVVEARRDSSWYLLQKLVRRHRGKAAVAALLIAVAIWTVGVLIVRYREEARLRNQAQQALQEAQRQSHIAGAVNAFLNDDLLASVSPENKGRQVSVREVLDSASKTLNDRFNDEPLVKAQIHQTLGNTYRGLSEFSEASRHLETAHNLLRVNSGENSAEAVDIALDLVRVYEEEGRYSDAEKLCRENFEILKRQRGANDVQTIRAHGDLGWLLFRMDRADEGEKLQREALTATESNKYDDLAVSITNSLAVIIRQRGRLEEAEALQIKAVDLAQRIKGPEHPETLTAKSNLADINRALKRFDAAEKLYKEVLDVRRRVQGPTHMRTLNTLNNFAAFYAGQLRDAEAARLFEEGLKAGDSQLDKNHPTMITMRSNLGFIYDRMDRHSEAEPLHVAAAEGIKAIMPPGHSNVGLYVKRLGCCRTDLEKYSEAEKSLREAYPILEKSKGPTSNDARECARDLAICCDHLGKSDEAAEWRKKAAAD